jgi:hypothetical protein
MLTYLRGRAGARSAAPRGDLHARYVRYVRDEPVRHWRKAAAGRETVAYVSIRMHTSAYVSGLTYLQGARQWLKLRSAVLFGQKPLRSATHTASPCSESTCAVAYVSIRSSIRSIRSIRQHTHGIALLREDLRRSIRQHT